MPAEGAPAASISHLHRPDGSATFSYAGYTVIAAVNGPIEAQRRDEDPEEAFVDVIVRPAAGVGGTRERHLESILQATIRQLLLIKQLPRALVQVILQITATPENDYVNNKLVQANTNLPVLPALIQSAVLALLSASLPMKAVATATAVAVLPDKSLVVDPSPRELYEAESLHILAFTSKDELLLVESEGDFDLDRWDAVVERAKRACCQGRKQPGLDLVLDDVEVATDMREFIRSTVEAQVAADLYWK